MWCILSVTHTLSIVHVSLSQGHDSAVVSQMMAEAMEQQETGKERSR